MFAYITLHTFERTKRKVKIVMIHEYAINMEWEEQKCFDVKMVGRSNVKNLFSFISVYWFIAPKEKPYKNEH